MKYIDYYEVLGVTKTATEKEIKQAYRQLARKHHPDLHQGDAKTAAEEKFKLINEAYEVLGDPDKRTKYDKLGMNWKAGEDIHFDPDGRNGFTYTYQGNPTDFDLSGFGFSDFFSQIFGQDFARGRRGGPSRQAVYKGEDVDAEITLSVNELIAGTEKDIYLSIPNVCAACEGQRFTERGVCQACNGSGVKEDTRTVRVKIPAGMHPGSSLRLKELGGKGYGGGPAGDLYLRIRLDPHSAWRLNGSDLEADLTLHPEQAVLGDKLQAPTPHGPVQLKIQPGIRTGQKLRLKNKGLPKADGSNGDLYFKIIIDIPTNISPVERELYQKILELRRTSGKQED